MILFRYDPELHWVPRRYELTEWLQRKFENPCLFVYKSLKPQSWSVAMMAEDKPGMMEDIFIIGKVDRPMMHMSRDKIKRIDYILNGPAKDPCKIVSQMDRDNRQKLIDVNTREREIKRWMGKRIPYFDGMPGYC